MVFNRAAQLLGQGGIQSMPPTPPPTEAELSALDLLARQGVAFRAYIAARDHAATLNRTLDELRAERERVTVALGALDAGITVVQVEALLLRESAVAVLLPVVEREAEAADVAEGQAAEARRQVDEELATSPLRRLIAEKELTDPAEVGTALRVGESRARWTPTVARAGAQGRSAVKPVPLQETRARDDGSGALATRAEQLRGLIRISEQELKRTDGARHVRVRLEKEREELTRIVAQLDARGVASRQS